MSQRPFYSPSDQADVARHRWLRLIGGPAVALLLLFLFLWIAPAQARSGSSEATLANDPLALLSLPDQPTETDHFPPPAIPALQGTPALTVNIVSSPWATLDNTTPLNGPRVFVVEAVITNTGTAVANNVIVTLNYNSPAAGWVLLPNENPIRTINSLAAGAAYHAYWFASYPANSGASYTYSVSAQADGVSPVSTSRNVFGSAGGPTIQTRSTQSTGNSAQVQANANIRVGIAFTVTVLYDLGQNPQAAIFSPVGNLGFNPSAYRLLATQARFLNNSNAEIFRVNDRLYVPNLPASVSQAQVLYTFIALTPSNTSLCTYAAVEFQSSQKYDKNFCISQTTVPITGTLAISVTKSVNRQTVQQNELLVYTINYTNNGSLPMEAVWFWDDLPANLVSVVNGSISPANDPAETTASRVAWDIGGIPAAGNPGSSGTLSFSVLVDGNGQDIANNTPIVNNAFMGINPGSFPQRAALTRTTTTIVRAPTVTVSKTDGRTSAQPGDTFAYTIRITNTGAIPATGLVITDVLPANVIPSPATPPANSQNGQTLVWTSLGPIAANGGVVNISIPVTVSPQAPDGSNLVNTVNVRYRNQANHTFAIATATDQTAIQAPTLAISKRESSDPILAGQILTYTLYYTNSGSAAATNAVITDALPLGTTYQSCSGGTTCNQSGGIVSWTIGPVPSGSSGSVRFIVLVSNALPTGTLLENMNYGIRADRVGFIVGPPVTTQVSREAAFIEGFAFEDSDGDGLRDLSEIGLANVQITLTQAVTPALTTDANGYYRFRIEQTIPVSISSALPAGYFRTTPGQVVFLDTILGVTRTVNFGYAPNNAGFGVIFGTVFEDSSRNSLQDLGEDGLSGVTVSSSDATPNSTTTNGLGQYTLRFNSSGAVTIIETDPVSYVSTTPNNVNTTATAGSSGSSPINFGDFRGIRISGQVFNDINANNLNDDGVGVAGAVVSAGGVNFNTTSSGVYTLYVSITDGVPLLVQETDPAGYMSTTALPGSGLSLINANRLQIDNPTSGNTYSGSFGDVLASNVITISGQVWDDNGAGGGIAANGVLDGSEPGLAGAVVSLNTGLTYTTGANGLFTLLAPANQPITISEANPAGYISTIAIPGSNASRVNNDILLLTALPGGSTSTNHRFGDILQTNAALVSGTVFDDANENGVFDGGDSGLSGIEVTLEVENSYSLSLTTDANGNYQFAVVPGQNVRLTSSGPGGAFYPTSPEAIYQSITSATPYPNNNFGYSDDSDVSVIMGLVFNDANGNGQQNFGESGLAGAMITLKGGQAINTTGTGAFAYAVNATELYTVQETDPAGYRSTTPNTVNVPVTALGQAYFVAFGDTNSTSLGVIYGTVFDDLNGNGLQDNTEPGLPGVTVNIGTGAGSFPQTTNAYGQYSFGSSSGGIHTVSEQNLPGYRSTTPDTINVAVNTNQSYEVNFGDTQATGFSSIIGLVFNDGDSDGRLDATEVGIGGVTVDLSGGQSTTTDVNGTYTFAVTSAGPVNVTETDPAGYHSTTPNTVPVSVTLPLSQTYVVNFGDNNNSFVSSIFGTVFEDQDENGAREITEPPLRNVMITVSGLGSTLTNEWGQYTFLIENAATYTIVETDPPAYDSTNAIPGNQAVTKIDNNTLQAVVSSLGTDLGDNQFGDIPIDSCNLDAYEIDDVAAQAQVVALGNQPVVQNHTFHVTTDQDWIRLTAKAGATYFFETSNLGALADTQLILYAADGTTILDQNDDGATNSQASRIEWTAPLTTLSQTVYLVVNQTEYNALSCNTDYTLSLQQASNSGGNLDNAQTNKTVEYSDPDLPTGSSLTYRIAVHNNGSLLAVPVTITDTLPGVISFGAVSVCEQSGDYAEYSLTTGSNGFVWQGAIGPGVTITLCAEGTVAAAPWNSTNTALINWNGTSISRSVALPSQVTPANTIFLPIVLK